VDAHTLWEAMGRTLSQAKYAELLPTFEAGMRTAQCTNPARAAMWCAQIGHESLGLLYMEEIASGQAYEGRRDLGNTQPGDGRRFKGRGPIRGVVPDAGPRRRGRLLHPQPDRRRRAAVGVPRRGVVLDGRAPEAQRTL